MQNQHDILSWLHIGDLHITTACQQNYADLLRIIELVRPLRRDSLDFALLPGDNADDGTPEQFSLVRNVVARLKLKLHILPGDHDFKPGTLDAFHTVLGAAKLPKSVIVRGRRCLFLDVVSAGTGGPDFRLGAEQLAWTESEVAEAAAAQQEIALFMHTYPADLREGGERLGALLALPHVTCVDMGHTHYNEVTNDGRTIFMTTRSTGQIEEGPPGFSIAAVDAGGVSWRFKTLDQAWPFVLITHPVDHRLTTRADQIVAGPVEVRAKILCDSPLVTVEACGGDGDWVAMVSGAGQVWHATVTPSAAAGGRIDVRVRDAMGRADLDSVEPAGPGWAPPPRTADGSDADRVGAWPERGILDTQLGPNRNGRAW